jgi:hypothetical protein
MSDTPEAGDEITVSEGDEVMFRLHDGRRPLAYPDVFTRIAYEVDGVDVLHTGEVWEVGYVGDVGVLELGDGTVVAIEDIDPYSVVITHAADTDEEDES